MIIRLKYFGAIGEQTHKQIESLEVPISTTVGQLTIILSDYYGFLKNMNYTIAINHTISEHDVVINEADEIAILPAFAGG